MSQATRGALRVSKRDVNRVVWIYVAMAGAAVAGCTAQGELVRPPSDAYYFPTALVASPDESRVFVVNGNSDLRFAAGSVVVLDTNVVAEAADAWGASLGTDDLAIPAGCEQDVQFRITLQCESDFALLPGASVRIGNFGSAIDVQPLDNGFLRLFLAVRGDPSVTWMDYDPQAEDMDCGSDGTQPVCTDAHRLTSIAASDTDPGIQLIDEPFGLFVDATNEYTVITHLTTGAVTLGEAPASGDAPALVDAAAGLFAADPNTGVRGAVGVAGRLPGTNDAQLYVTSRTDSRIQTLSVVRPDPLGGPRLAVGDYFFMREVSPADDGRGIAFGQGGERAYVVNRDPPLLHIIDTSIGVDGQPANTFIAGVEICAGAANLAVVDTAVGERIYLTCFREGQVWSIDPEGAVVDAVIDVGRGPQALLGLPGKQKLVVANFLGNTLAVVDLTPGAVGENRVVMRLGITGEVPGAVP